VNTTWGSRAVRDSYAIRRQTLLAGVPYFTTMAAALAAADAIADGGGTSGASIDVRALQQWHAGSS
jgi:carbamoyl-phosphate synthase large subunit